MDRHLLRRLTPRGFRLGHGLLALSLSSLCWATPRPRQADLESLRALVVEANEAEAARDFERALALYAQALTEHDELDQDALRGARALHAFSRRGQANALFELGRYRDVLEETADAERVAAALPGSGIELWRLRSAAFGRLGLPDRAEAPMRTARELLATLDEGETEWAVTINVLTQVIRAELALGRYDAARSAADEALEQIWDSKTAISPQEHDTAEATVMTLRGVALCVLALQDPRHDDEAEATLSMVLESEGAFATDRQLATTYLLALRLLRGDRAAAEVLLDEAQPSAEHALAHAAARARLAERAGDPVALKRARAELRGLLDAFVATWQVRADGPGFGILGDRLTRFAWEQALALHEGRELLELLLKLQSCASLSLSRSRVTAKDVLATIVHEREVGCLVVQPGWDRGRAVAFDGERLASFVLPGGHDLMQRVQRYEILLAQDPGGLSPRRQERRRDELRALGASIAGTLFPAELIAFLRPWKELRIVGRNLLRELSFETLPVVNGEPLGVTHAVSNLPSLAAGVALARREAPPEGDVALFAAPALAAPVRSRFPWVADLTLDPELPASLNDRLGSTGTLRMVTGKQANRATLNELLSSRPRVLHIVSHGVLDLAEGVWPHVALAPGPETPDGLLGFQDVLALNAPPLVVLSACETGKGAERIGDAGSYHLGGAFLEAGARSVVLSSQRIRLGTALAFSKEIYAGLGRDGNSARAMQRARAAMLASEAFADPFHWGLTFVYGLGD